jgi:hypothetical protein
VIRPLRVLGSLAEIEKGSFRNAVINAVKAGTIAAERAAKEFDSEYYQSTTGFRKPPRL